MFQRTSKRLCIVGKETRCIVNDDGTFSVIGMYSGNRWIYSTENPHPSTVMIPLKKFEQTKPYLNDPEYNEI